jgi:hypothetical protein
MAATRRGCIGIYMAAKSIPKDRLLPPLELHGLHESGTLPPSVSGSVRMSSPREVLGHCRGAGKWSTTRRPTDTGLSAARGSGSFLGQFPSSASLLGAVHDGLLLWWLTPPLGGA